MKTRKRILSAILALSMTSSMFSAFAVNAYAETIYAEESEAISDEIKNSGEFYVATPNVNMTEGAGEKYVATIKRGGDNLEAASVRLTLLDITAQYGKDYTIEVPDKGFFEADVENKWGAKSIYALAGENDGKLDEVNGLDEIAAMNKTDEEIQEMYNEDMQSLSEGLSGELQEYVEEKAAETGKTGEEIIKEAAENQNSLSKAFEDATGLKDDSAPMDGGTMDASALMSQYSDDKMTELASQLDSPYIILDFAEGETEKTIEILPKDNGDAEGNKMFLANLFPESDNAVISEIKGITAVIEDDEEWSEPMVGFAESVYYPENGFADITIKRDGVTTDVAAVKLTTSDGTAMGGRDYSQVDTTVVFPYGISERTIKVPVSSEYIDTAVNYNLTLSDAQNCTLGENMTALGIVEANSVSYKDTEAQFQLMAEEAGLGDVIVSDEQAIDVLKPYSSGYTGPSWSRVEGNDYVLIANADVQDEVWSWAYWDTKDRLKHYDYDGYQIDWTKESEKPCYTDNVVRMFYGGSWHTVWENSDERWERKQTNIYPKQNEIMELKISVSQKGAVYSKRAKLKIHSIKPILRPFEVSLKQGDPLKFRNENGDYVDNTNIPKLADATSALLQNATKTGTGTAIKFSGEKITVTTTSKFAYIKGLKIVHPSNGTSKVIKDGLPSGTTSVSIDLTNDFIRQNLDYVNFTSNGGSRIKGQFMVQPIFDYYDVTVNTHNDNRATIMVNDSNPTPRYALYSPSTGKYLSAKNGIGGELTLSDTVDKTCEWEMRNEWKVKDEKYEKVTQYKVYNPAAGGVITAPLNNDDIIYESGKPKLEEETDNYKQYIWFHDTPYAGMGNILLSLRVTGMYKPSQYYGIAATDNGVGIAGFYFNYYYIAESTEWQKKLITDLMPDYPDPDSSLTFHRGDTVKFTQVIRDNYKSTYGSSRIRFIKRETSDSEAIDDKSKYNAGADSYNLFCDYATVDAYVNLDKKDNQVIVRVTEAAAYYKFDTSTGIFKNPYVRNGNYRDYIVVPPDKFSANEYIEMTAKTKYPDRVAEWTTPSDGKTYSQETFYYETNNNGDNIITLKGDYIADKFSLTGTAHYSEVALSGQTEGAAWRPASGVYVSLGNDYYGLSDTNGNFATIPASGVNGKYQIYKIETGGGTKYSTVKLSSNKTIQVDNGKGGTDTVRGVPIGDIKTSVTRADVPHATAFTASNFNGVISGNVALISDDATYMTTTIMNNGATYTDSDGKERTERVKKVEFVIYDPITNKERSVVEGDAREITNVNGMSVWQMLKTFKKNESHLYTASDKIYVRVTTDRVKGNGKTYNEKGELVEIDALNETTYPDVYTGYTLATTNMEKPVTNDFDLFDGDLDDFLTLPVIGSMNSTFVIKKVALSISELPEGGFRLSIGYVKGKEDAEPDDDNDHKVPFTPDRIKHEIKKVGAWGDLVGPKNAVGVAGGGIYPMFGIYLDFGLKKITHMDDTHTQQTKLLFLGGGAMLGATGSYRFVIYGAIGPVPVYFGIDGSLAVMANIGFKLKNKDTLSPDSQEYEGVSFQDIKSGDKKIQDEVLFDFALHAHGLLNIYVGAGIAGTFGIRGGAAVSVAFIYYPFIVESYESVNPVGINITVGLKIWVDLVLLSIPSPELTLADEPFGYYKDIRRLKSDNPSLMSADEAQTAETDKYGAFLRKGSGKDEVWLPEGNGIQLMSTFEKEKTTVLSEGGYENASPQLMDLGNGRILLVYLANDMAKGEYDRTSISYSVYDNGVWGESVKIDTASTKADFEPNLTDIGDKVLVSWTSRNNGDNRTDSADYLKGMNVFSTTIDKTTLAIGDIEQLTNDDYYNSHPVGLYDEKSKDYAVYYLKAEVTNANVGDEYKDSVESEAGANLLTIASPTTNGAKLMYKLHDKTKGWMTTDEKLSNDESVLTTTGERFVVSEIEELAGTSNSTSPRIIDFNAVSYDGKGVYAYTIDLDNNIDTTADRELYIQIYDFEEHKNYKPIRITNDTYADSEPQLVRNGDKTYLFWREDQSTIRFVDIANLVTNGLENSNEAIKNVTLDNDNPNNTTPLYQLDQSRVSSALDDPEMTPSYANYKAFVDKDGNMFVAWTQGEYENDENGNITNKSLEVYATAYIQETETVDGVETPLDSSWSEGMRLTKSDRYNDGIAVWTDKDGNLITVNNQYDIDEEKSEATNIKLVSTEYKTVGSAEIKDVRYDDNTPLAGSANTVSIDVKNNGLKAMNGFTLRAYEVKNGNVSSEPVFETTSTERVTPSSIAPVSFDWQMPDNYDDVDSLSLHITVQETGYDKINEYDSDSIEIKPEYVLHDVRTFQTSLGIMVRYDVENTGNVDGSSDDANVVMSFVDAYDTGAEAMDFLNTPVPSVKAGETYIDIDLLDIPPEGYFKYGRLNSTAEIRDTEGNVLSQYENLHIALEHPRYVGMDNDELPLDVNETRLTIPMKEGDEFELNGAYSDDDFYVGGTVQFISSDPSVASVIDGKLYALSEGTTHLTAAVYPFGGVTNYYVEVEGTETPDPTPTPKRSGGGGSSSSNKVNVYNSGTSANGNVSVSKTNPSKGETVTVTVTPDEGYELDKLVVTDKDGNEIEVTKNEDGTYSFVQPSGSVTVTPEFKKIDTDNPDNPNNNGKDDDWWFKDVPDTTWYYSPIKDAYDAERMSGMSDDYFEPETDITRGMFAYAIYRREGLPETDTENKFEDVKAGSYYETAIAWATENEIVAGYDDTHYGPDDQITREQMAAILWRYAKFKEYDVSVGEDTNILDFTDAQDISEYAIPAIQWAVGDSVITGFEDSTMRPKANANRAQMAVILNKIADMF